MKTTESVRPVLINSSRALGSITMSLRTRAGNQSVNQPQNKQSAPALFRTAPIQKKIDKHRFSQSATGGRAVCHFKVSRRAPPLGNDLRGPPSEQQEALDYLPDRGCAPWRTGSWVVHGKIDLLSFPSSFIQYELKNKGLKTFTYIYHIYIYMKGHFVSSPSTKYPPISQKVISHFFFFLLLHLFELKRFWISALCDVTKGCQSGASYLSYFCTLQNTL